MSRPLRILQVADLYDPFIGGTEQHVKTLSRGLVHHGHEVMVATAHLPGTAYHEAIDGLQIKRIAGWSSRALARWYEQTEAPVCPPVPDPGAIAALKKIITELRPDIVNAQGWISYSCLAIAQRRWFRLVVTAHDYGFACVRKTMMRNGAEACSGPRLDACLRCAPGQYGSIKGSTLTMGLRAARPLHNRVDSWVAVSKFLADSLRRSILRDCAISVIPPASAEQAPLANRPSWLPSDGYLLFVGALGRHKGINWLLDAYAGGEVRQPLVIVGSARHDTPRTWPAGVVVRTDVPHQEVMEAWRHARMGVVPSLWPEAFGLVAVEAMRSGIPVVASRIGALPGLVTDNLTGILVTPGNAPELRAALRRLENDPQLRRTMGAAALIQAQQFSAETVTTMYEQHYRELLTEHPRRD